MATTSRLTEADCQNVRWEVVEITPTYRRSVGHGTHPVSGLPITVQRTEYLADEALQEQNRQSFDASFGERFGDGKIVARIPMNKFLADFAGKMQEGDKDHAKWLLNSEAYRPFRTFRGRI